MCYNQSKNIILTTGPHYVPSQHAKTQKIYQQKEEVVCGFLSFYHASSSFSLLRLCFRCRARIYRKRATAGDTLSACIAIST